MSRRQRRWEQLQSRWASGEPLSADEESERLDYAAREPAARRELEFFSELRARAAFDVDSVSPALIDSVIDSVQGRPRLRLVTPVEREPKGPFDERRPARQRALLVAAALVAAAAAGTALVVQPSVAPRPVASALPSTHPLPMAAARAVLVMAARDVQVDGLRAGVGQGSLREGQRIATRDGGACLKIDSDIEVCLADNSVVELQSLAAHSIGLRVEAGTALASLGRRPPGSSFSLISGEISAHARGTTFAARRTNGESEVIVLDGAVDVVRGGDPPERVAAHSRVLLRAARGALERPALERSDETRLVALGSWHELWAGDALGTLHVLAAPQAALRVSIDDQPPLPLPLEISLRAGKHRVTWRNLAGGAVSSWINVAAGESQRVDPPLRSREMAAPEERADTRGPAALLEAARREVGRARPGDALALYERLRTTYPSSAEARTVLVTMGKLELNLGRQERALRHFDMYLGHGGALAPEALAGKIRALRALGRRVEERHAIRQYLARHPRGLEAPLFEKRLRELVPP